MIKSSNEYLADVTVFSSADSGLSRSLPPQWWRQQVFRTNGTHLPSSIWHIPEDIKLNPHQQQRNIHYMAMIMEWNEVKSLNITHTTKFLGAMKTSQLGWRKRRVTKHSKFLCTRPHLRLVVTSQRYTCTTGDITKIYLQWLFVNIKYLWAKMEGHAAVWPADEPGVTLLAGNSFFVERLTPSYCIFYFQLQSDQLQQQNRQQSSVLSLQNWSIQ